MPRVGDRIDIKAIHQRLKSYGDWEKPQAWGEDAWFILRRYFGQGIIVSLDLASQPGVEWVHASISYQMRERIPSYSDLKMLHRVVFGAGHAYQCFVPPSEHVNITSNVLHLWGRRDGQPVLPDFGRHGTI
jgi:hypothetical protein